MLLSTQNAAFYLMERGWLPPAAVVDGDVTMVEASRRNKNLKVLRNEGPSLFLKQAGQWDPQSMNTLRVESVVYQLASSDTPFQALRPLLPRFHGFDPDRHVLVLEALPGAESLHVRQLRENAISPDVARALGAALGGVHRDLRADPAAAVPQGTFQAQPPWILSAAEMAGHPMQGVSGAGLQLFQVLQRYPEFPKLLAELRQGWKNETLIHGDIKWDNFLVATGEDGKHSVHLIDWELADWGDPSWDAGAVLQGFLTSWVSSIQAPGPIAPGEVANFAQLPLTALRPAIRAFWNAYVEALGVDRAEADRRLDRAVRYGAARMVQTAYEFLQFSQEIAGPAVWLLQVSLNLLKDPRRGTVELFAL